MKEFLEDFKKFALKGNVLDLAVGVVIGGAFGKIVTSLVNDIIMPLVGLLTGGINFREYKIVLTEVVGNKAAVYLNVGMFIQNIVDFLIIAFSIFIAIKFISKFERKKEKEIAVEKEDENLVLLREIRDLLKKSK
ncbi:large-conductance mechanosensitive channel protein MscL [Romboutsia maritimum]|uniref:Large-conductance mechanosensitive channel n=1 Tax=Romboutsia maritimum TaxID=2020948 RepID=A0A371ITK5_9FIRM|nr:large-conductance mechanosensitive channel protein MscL [Romboutsia maritimum]RDY23789.1 large-conductance mechanosensitive channel protein MscL [Romboutsia maritimum]